MKIDLRRILLVCLVGFVVLLSGGQYLREEVRIVEGNTVTFSITLSPTSTVQESIPVQPVQAKADFCEAFMPNNLAKELALQLSLTNKEKIYSDSQKIVNNVFTYRYDCIKGGVYILVTKEAADKLLAAGAHPAWIDCD